MFIIIESWPELKIGHVRIKTRSLGQFLEKPCVLSRRHSFDPIFKKLCQNDFLTLNKHLSRRAMLSADSSCYETVSRMSFFFFFVFFFDNLSGILVIQRRVSVG